MPTNVKTSAMTWPYPLGKVYPGAAFSTASVPLTQNIQPANADLSPDNRFNAIWMQASPGNSGYIYICSTAAAPDKVAYSNVLGVMPAGQWFPRTKEWANNRALNTLFIGADNATDFAIVSIDQF